MTIQATVIEDSVSAQGHRLLTLELYYPRIIHAEFMTHRVFSRNASSSRATPLMTMLRNTIADMAEPVQWGSNNPGMQSKAPLTGWRLWLTRKLWRATGYVACGAAWMMYRAGAHKQIANRIIEPWSHIRVVLTTTDLQNFLALRDHPDADPTIHLLAKKIREAATNSTPKLLAPGEWHLPYVTDQDRSQYGDVKNADGTPFLARISAARCARVSYLNFHGRTPSHAEDIRLWEQLVESKPVHASPTEHQGTPDTLWSRGRWAKPGEHGNFRGWRQHRKMIPGEAVREQ